MDIFMLSCSCGKHDFIFGQEPVQKVEVKCPECELLTTYDPNEGLKELKEDEADGGKTEQE